MLRSSRLIPLLTLVVGGLSGWAVASGECNSIEQSAPGRGIWSLDLDAIRAQPLGDNG